MSLRMAKNPTGGVTPQHVMERHSLDPVSVQYVVKRDNVLKAWKQVRANKGAAGVDNISIEEFPVYAHENWKGIKKSLLEGEYKPSPVKRVEIRQTPVSLKDEYDYS